MSKKTAFIFLAMVVLFVAMPAFAQGGEAASNTSFYWAIPLGAFLFSLLYSGTRFLNFFPLSLFDSGSRAFLRLFLVGLLLVLFMAFRPQGILGDRRQLLLEK